jgi:DnaJ-class molecular chaperone
MYGLFVAGNRWASPVLPNSQGHRMLKLTTTSGQEILLEEPCPNCSGTGVFSRGGGMLTGLCQQCGGRKSQLTDNAHAIIELVQRKANGSKAV